MSVLTVFFITRHWIWDEKENGKKFCSKQRREHLPWDIIMEN